MSTIKLSKYGHLFSSRSRAKAIVEENIKEDLKAITIDFEGIETATQAFVSQMLVTLSKEKDILLKNVHFIGTDERMKKRTTEEKERLINLYQKTD